MRRLDPWLSFSILALKTPDEVWENCYVVAKAAGILLPNTGWGWWGGAAHIWGDRVQELRQGTQPPVEGGFLLPMQSLTWQS